MRILAIETSCDETGVSILEIKETKKGPLFKVLADSLNSQVKIHAKFGGVFPALAKREHIKNLPILLERTLRKAKISKKDLQKPVDLITVTSGPGLEPALWTGIVFAKELAQKWNVPLVPVNHMEGHVLSVFGKEKGVFQIPKINYPVLSLLVSGGHTELVLSKDFRKYKIIGKTLDDAAGEAFDKVARMLELPYPGGPEISRLAQETRKENIKTSFSLPRPMLHSKNFDFSFSGLKTAVLYLIRDLVKENPKVLENIETKKVIALEFENAVVETLIHKTKKVIEKYEVETLIVAGGVAANKYLRKKMKELTGKNVTLLFPDKKLATDNSIMIGIAGYFKYIQKGKKSFSASKIKAEGNLSL